MPIRRCAATCLLLATLGAEEPAPLPVPWAETFTMEMKENARTFVVYQGSSWLMLRLEDANDRELMRGSKDVVLETKLGRGVDGRLTIFGFPQVQVEADPSLLRTRLEGDNVFLFGQLGAEGEQATRFRISAVEPAPSDQQRIAHRLAPFARQDWPGRLKAAAALRDEAARHQNKEFWLSAADNAITRVIEDAAAEAETKRDFPLLMQAISWSVELLKDRTRAGQVGSAAWVKGLGPEKEEELARRLRRLDLEPFKGVWLPRSEALQLEFEERFAAIPWRDAEGFYRLGRWADANGEFLPRAKDRAYRCYAEGLKADPNHAGIRNELGMARVPAAVAQQGAAQATTFIDPVTGVTVGPPPGWRQAEAVDGVCTWSDPASETSYISISVQGTPEGATLDVVWSSLVAPIQSKAGFLSQNDSTPLFAQGAARQLSYTFLEGAFTRHGELLVAHNPAAKVAVRIVASYALEEQEGALRALSSVFQQLVIPNQPPEASAP